MRNSLVVLRREYLQRVRSKAFLISTVATPLILLVIFVVPLLVESRTAQGGSASTLLLVDRTGVLAEGIQSRLTSTAIPGSPPLRIEILEPGGATEDRARIRVAEGEVLALLELDEESLARGRARWIGTDPPSLLRGANLRQALVQSALELRLTNSGVSEGVEELLRGGKFGLSLLGVGVGGRDREAGVAAGVVGAFLLYFVLLVYGSMVLRSVLEEKTTRIVEIILSSMEPWELMLGKILGVGSVGLTQLSVWALSAAAIGGVGLPSMVTRLPAEVGLPEIRTLLPEPWIFVYFGACFLLGFFLYASLFAAVGAMCTTEEEAQQLQFPVVMLVVIPVLLLMPMIQNPESAFAVGISLVPFFSPILMFARAAAGAAAPWEVLLSILLMSLTVLLVARLAGRVYEVGILMQGKRPTLPEILRWVRAG